MQAALKDRYSIKQHRDLLHIEIPLSEYDTVDLFVFSYGVAVFWGFPEDADARKFLDVIKEFEDQPYEYLEKDIFTYTIGSKPKIYDDEIVLPDLQSLSLIAVSHSIAQSVKLGSFEVTVQGTWLKMKEIPEQLAKTGRISLSKNKIRKQIGSLFLERAWINLHVDVLEVPEFFWEFPEVEPLYTMTAVYLEVKSRVEVLNRRLDVMHDLFEMLVAEQNHQHSSRLEWAIIVLIFIEIFLVLAHEIFKIV